MGSKPQIVGGSLSLVDGDRWDVQSEVVELRKCMMNRRESQKKQCPNFFGHSGKQCVDILLLQESSGRLPLPVLASVRRLS